jgi:hypothetical protein
LTGAILTSFAKKTISFAEDGTEEPQRNQPHDTNKQVKVTGFFGSLS